MTILDWLIDSDPSIRWHVMRDLSEEPAESVAMRPLRRSRSARSA
ncbi:MAG TPA: hypothetical protein VMS99_12320 [Acidimicrobiia bacterium]|nr:hypothetical protein [Acidimicrobiia bacterium]